MRESHACYIACRERQARGTLIKALRTNLYIHTGLFAVLTLSACWIVLDGHNTLVKATATLVDLDTSLKTMNSALASANGAIAQINLAAKNINGIAVDEAPRLKKEAEVTLKLTAHTNDLVSHTDLNLNGERGVLPLLYASLRVDILPEVDRILRDADAGVRLTNEDLRALQNAINETNKVVAAVNERATD